MIQINESALYKAEEGNVIIRKEDNSIMGDAIYLGELDSIDNYTEIDAPKEETEENKTDEL